MFSFKMLNVEVFFRRAAEEEEKGKHYLKQHKKR